MNSPSRLSGAEAAAPLPGVPSPRSPAGDLPARSPAEVYELLGSSPGGLTAATAAARLSSAGPNELPAAKRPPVIRKVLAQFTNLFAVVLLGASVITFGLLPDPVAPGRREPGAGHRHPGRGPAQRRDRVLPGVLGREDIRSAPGHWCSHTARVRRDGALSRDPRPRRWCGVTSFVLEAGDDICCDGRLVEAHDLTVDDVALTGESAPVRRTAAAAPAGTATMDAANLVFMGTSVVEGTGTAVAFATGAGHRSSAGSTR